MAYVPLTIANPLQRGNLDSGRSLVKPYNNRFILNETTVSRRTLRCRSKL